MEMLDFRTLMVRKLALLMNLSFTLRFGSTETAVWDPCGQQDQSKKRFFSQKQLLPEVLVRRLRKIVPQSALTLATQASTTNPHALLEFTKHHPPQL